MRGNLVTLLAIALLAGCGQPTPGGGGGGRAAPSPAPTARPGGGGAGPAAPATPAPVSVSGNWVVTYQFNPSAPGRDQLNYNATGSLALTQTGASVSGTYTEPNYTAAVAGNVSGRTLNLTIGPTTRDGMSTTITHQSTIAPNGNSASGSVTVTARGQSRSLQLTGRSSLTRR